ncbi:MAG: hypothetical protein FNT15_08885 [Sulfurovum sp.]|nr:MAG: hypothetical protein FNT15_08885 [Sulfurovum sp.]
MSLELISFAYDYIKDGVGESVIKSVLGGAFERLYGYVTSNDKDKFTIALETLLESNEKLKEELLGLKSDKDITNSMKNITDTTIEVPKGTTMDDSFKEIEDSTIKFV